ncbi:MAG: hypothetical protein ACI88H_000702 [Cocleimonas sp.]|jgi:hypothetical protein
MNKLEGQQLDFNFQNDIKELIPKDITLDELLYVLNNHSDSELACRYYFDRINKERCKK